MAQALIKGSSLYANPYEEAYTRAKFLRNFNQNTWEEAILRGDQDRYLKLLRDTDKVDLDASFYDPLQYSYENQILQLEAQLADDTEIKDYSNLKDVDSYKEFIRQKIIADGVDLKRAAFDKDYGKQVNDKYKPMIEGQITDKMYLDYIIKQDRAAKEAEITYLRERAHKEAMSGWTKARSVGALFGEIGEGALRGLAAFFDVLPATIYGTVSAIQEKKNWFDAFTEYYDLGLMSMESNVGNALAEYERKYTSFRTIDGELTTSGKYLGQTANAIGYMLPSIVLASVTGGASIGIGSLQIGVGNLAFYIQIFSQNVYENQTNPLTSGSPGWMKFTNALTQAVSEAAIEYGLSKVLSLIGFSGSTVDRLRGAGRTAGDASRLARFTEGMNKIASKEGILLGLKKMGMDAVHEGLEEFFQDMGDMLINYFTDMLRDGYGYNEFTKPAGIDMQTLVDSFITGALMSLAMAPAKPLAKNFASKVDRKFGHEMIPEVVDEDGKPTDKKVRKNKDSYSKFDTYAFTSEGELKRLGVFQSIAFSELMENFKADIDALANTKVGEGNANEILEKMKTVYGITTNIGQFFNEIATSPERIANIKKMYDYIQDHQVLTNTGRNNIADQLRDMIRIYNETGTKYETEGDKKSANLYYKKAVYLSKNFDKIIKKRQSLQLKTFCDAAFESISAMLSTDIKLKKYKDRLEKEIEELRRQVEQEVAAGGDNQIAEADATTVTAVATDGEVVATTEDIAEELKTDPQRKLEALMKIYDTIFVTDGHDTIVNDTTLFCPQSWLTEGYPLSEIFRHIATQESFQQLIRMDALNKPAEEGGKSFFDQLRETDAALRGVDPMAITKTQALMDFWFNPAVFTNMLFDNNGAYLCSNLKLVFGIIGSINTIAKRAKNKGMYDKVIAQLRQTVRKPVMQAIIKYNLQTWAQTSGVYDILDETDRTIVNMELKRRFTLATGSPRQAFEALTEDTLRAIDENEDLQNKSPKMYELLQKYKKGEHLTDFQQAKVAAYIHIFEHEKMPGIGQRAFADVILGRESNYTNYLNYRNVPESSVNLGVPAESYYGINRDNPDTVIMDACLESFNEIFGDFDSFCKNAPILAEGMTFEKLGQLMIYNENETFQDFAVYTLNNLLYNKFKDQRYFVEARRGQTKIDNERVANRRGRWVLETDWIGGQIDLVFKPIKTLRNTSVKFTEDDVEAFIGLTTQFYASSALDNDINYMVNGLNIIYDLWYYKLYLFADMGGTEEELSEELGKDARGQDAKTVLDKIVPKTFSSVVEMKEYMKNLLADVISLYSKKRAADAEKSFVILEGIPVTVESLSDDFKNLMDKIDRKDDLEKAFKKALFSNCVINVYDKNIVYIEDKWFTLVKIRGYDQRYIGGIDWRYLDREDAYRVSQMIQKEGYRFEKVDDYEIAVINEANGKHEYTLASFEFSKDSDYNVYYQGDHILTTSDIFSENVLTKYDILPSGDFTSIIDTIKNISISFETDETAAGRSYGKYRISLNPKFLSLSTLCHELNHSFADAMSFYENISQAYPQLDLRNAERLSTSYKKDIEDIFEAVRNYYDSDEDAYVHILYHLEQTERFARLKYGDRPINIASQRYLQIWHPEEGPFAPFKGTKDYTAFEGSDLVVAYGQFLNPDVLRESVRQMATDEYDSDEERSGQATQITDAEIETRIEAMQQRLREMEAELQGEQGTRQTRPISENNFHRERSNQQNQETQEITPITAGESRNFAQALVRLIKAGQNKDVYEEKGRGTERFHANPTSNAISEAMDVILDSELDPLTRNMISIDDVIKHPEKYLSKRLQKMIGNRINNEGYVYSFLQNYLLNTKKYKGISLDVYQPGGIETAKYVFVDDKAFDDILQEGIYREAKRDGTAVKQMLLREQKERTLTLADIYDTAALKLLGIPTDIKIEISTNTRGGSYFEITRENPQGLIHIGFSERGDKIVGDAELINYINHEFRHVLQSYNQFSQGFTNVFKVDNDMIADMKQHAPELFDANKGLRKALRITDSMSEKEADSKIVRAVIYLFASGEINARGLSMNVLGTKPAYVSTDIMGRTKVFMPWFDAETKAGMYNIDFGDKGYRIRNDMSDEYESPDEYDSTEELTSREDMIVDIALYKALQENLPQEKRNDRVRELMTELQEQNDDAIKMLWKKTKQQSEAEQAPVQQAPAQQAPAQQAPAQQAVEKPKKKKPTSSKEAQLVEQIVNAEIERLQNDPERRAVATAYLERLRNSDPKARKRIRTLNTRIMSLSDESFSEIYKFGSRVEEYTRESRREEIQDRSRYVSKNTPTKYEIDGKPAKAIDTNLRYFFKPGVSVHMSPALQDFIALTTGIEDQIDPVVMSAIKDGKLNQQYLLNKYFASTDFDPNSETAQATFDLINKCFFANDKFKSAAEVDNFTFSYLSWVWAAVKVMANYDWGLGIVLKENDLKTFKEILEQAALSSARTAIELQSTYFDEVEDINDEKVRLTASEAFNAKLRLYALRYFDGTISSAYYIAQIARRLLIEENRKLLEKVESLDAPIDEEKGKMNRGGQLAQEDVSQDADLTIISLNEYYTREAPIDEAKTPDEQLSVLTRLFIAPQIAAYSAQNPGMKEEQIYRKYNGQLLEQITIFQRKFLNRDGTIKPEKIPVLAKRYSEAVMANTIGNNTDVQYSTIKAARPQRGTLQAAIKYDANYLLTKVREGKVKWSAIPEEIQDMFEVKKNGSKSLKKETYMLDRLTTENGQLVYRKGKGRQKGDRLDLQREDYKRDVTKLNETATILHNFAEEVREKIRKGRTVEIQRLNERLSKKDARLQEVTRERDEYKRKAAELEKELKKKNRTVPVSTVTINPKEETRPTRKRKNESTVSAVRSDAVTIEVASFGNDIMPAAFQSILQTSFTEMADTQVQFISRNAEGTLFDRRAEDADEFKSNSEHEVTSLEAFMELNAPVLTDMTAKDVLDIVKYFKDGVYVIKGDARKFAAFEIFTLAYIVGNMRNKLWTLTEEDMQTIEKLFEDRAGMYGTGLRAVGQVQEIVNPYKYIVNRLVEDYGLDAEDFTELQKAVERYDKAETKVDQLQAAKDINEQIDIIEKLLKHKVTGKERFLAYSYTAKLSSPITWARNKVTNAEMMVMNTLSDRLMNFIFTKLIKKGYRDGQMNLADTKVTPEVKEWIKKNFIENPLFQHLLNGITKYNPNNGVTGKGTFDVTYINKDGKKVRAHLDSFIAVLAESLISDFNTTHKFVNDENDRKIWKGMQVASDFITRMISDSDFIKIAVSKYFGKIIQQKVNGAIDPETGKLVKLDLNDDTIITDIMMKDFAEAIRLAAADYMHKPSVMADLLAWLKREHPKTAYATSLLFPFINSSLNFFAEGLKMTPIGLASAIVRYARLEKEISNREELRKSQKGKILTDPRFTEFLIRRDIGKGIIGTLGTCLALVAAALGWVRVKEEDEKYKLQVGDVTVDVSVFLGTSSFITGLAIVDNIKKARADETIKWYTVLERCAVATFDALSEGFPLRDIYDRYNYTNTFGEAVLTFNDNFFRGFVPQFWQFFTNATRMYKVKYSSGLKGKIEKFIDAFVPGTTAGRTFLPGLESDFVINPYTGKLQSKWAIPIPVAGGLVSSFLKSIGGVYWTQKTAGEELSESLGVKKNPLTGKLTVNGKSIQLDYATVNEKYGQLNAASLSRITREKHRVQVKNGTYKELSWSQLDDNQKANVLNRMYDRNADIARIYTWTADGHKYYTGKDYMATLKKAGVKNVYYGDKGFVE